MRGRLTWDGLLSSVFRVLSRRFVIGEVSGGCPRREFCRGKSAVGDGRGWRGVGMRPATVGIPFYC